MRKELFMAMTALLPSSIWAQNCGSDSQADSLRRSLRGKPLAGHVFTSLPPLDSVCFSRAGRWAALTHWTEATGVGAAVFTSQRVVARLGDSVDGKYIAGFTSDSRVTINEAGQVAYSMLYADSREEASAGLSRWGIFVEKRLVFTPEWDGGLPDFFVSESGDVYLQGVKGAAFAPPPPHSAASQRALPPQLPPTGKNGSTAAPHTGMEGLEDDPGYQRLSPEGREVFRKEWEAIHRAIVEAETRATQPQAPVAPPTNKPPAPQSAQTPAGCADTAAKPKPKVRLRVPKALENLGRQVGVEVGDGAGSNEKPIVPCPVPPLAPGNSKGANR